MNQSLIKLNNNHGLVTDENGNISLISKENDSYDFKEILLKDNDLEELNLKLEMTKEQLDDNKTKTIAAKIMNTLVVGIVIFLYINLHSIASSVILYLYFKALLILTFGTRIERNNNKMKLTTDIEKMELEIQTLEKELTKIKEKSKYKINDSTVKVSTIDEEKTYTEMSLPLDSCISKENSKIRVLKLSKRK